MQYSDVVNNGLILPKKDNYTMRDVNDLLVGSLFNPVNGKTLQVHEAAFIIKCSAVYHDTEYSANVAGIKPIHSIIS